MRHILIGALVAVGIALQAQEKPSGDLPRFEVASVRPNKSGDRISRADYKGETVTITNRSLRDIIRLVYGIGELFALPQASVEGEPRWVDERYDIIAKTPGPVSSGVPPGVLGFGPPLNLMLQSLLAERFRFVARWETRERPGYALVLAAPDGRLGPNIRSSDVDCEAHRAAVAAGSIPPSPPRAPGEIAQRCVSSASGRRDGAYSHREFSLATQPIQTLVDRLAQSLGQPVIDRTGLQGRFDIRLTYSAELPAVVASEPSKRPVGPTLTDALRDQLGLKLEAQPVPAQVLVIDSVERPTPD
jgi:uncharacterized protein (TIGR03435 family)